MSIFITGATGQTGSQLAEYLIETQKLGVSSPKEIICLVRNLKKAEFLTKLGVRIEEGDLLDLKKLQNKLPDFDNLINIIDDLSIDPRPIGVRKIKGFDRTFRIRFRSYRIIYDIYDKNNRVLILRILRRSESTYKFR